MTLRFGCLRSKLSQRSGLAARGKGWHRPLNWATSRAATRRVVTVSPHLAPRHHGTGVLASAVGGAWAKRHCFERDYLMIAIVSAPAQPVRRVATCIVAVAALTVGTSLAFAQQPTQPVPAPNANPRPVQPAPQA